MPRQAIPNEIGDNRVRRHSRHSNGNATPGRHYSPARTTSPPALIRYGLVKLDWLSYSDRTPLQRRRGVSSIQPARYRRRMKREPRTQALLWDPSDDKSSCGVGFITRKDGVQSHEVIVKASAVLGPPPRRHVGRGRGRRRRRVDGPVTGVLPQDHLGVEDLSLGRFCVLATASGKPPASFQPLLWLEHSFKAQPALRPMAGDSLARRRSS